MKRGSEYGKELHRIEIEFHCCSWFYYILCVAEETGSALSVRSHFQDYISWGKVLTFHLLPLAFR